MGQSESLIPEAAEPSGCTTESYYMDPENRDWLKTVARQRKRSVSELLREILRAVRAQEAARTKGGRR
jgi:hypothetical protein